MIDNLEDAIAHCHEKAEELKKLADYLDAPYGMDTSARTECLECAKDHKQLAEWLTELQERREADRWVPVSERLPEEYVNCLVFTSDNDIDVGTFNQFENSWSMCDADGFYWAKEKGIEITHWRPLPKFYESEDKEGE